MIANGSIAMWALSFDARYQATPPNSEGVGDPVDHGVEERAALAGRVRRLGQRAVEQVGQRGQDHEHEADDAARPGAMATAAPTAITRPSDREVVGREPGAAQGVADRLDGPLDRRTELAVEHLTRLPAAATRTTVPYRYHRRHAPVSGRSHTDAWGSSTVKTYPTDKIRNVVLLGHGGSGKTTLAEALLARSGAITRAGQGGRRHDRRPTPSPRS